MTVAEDHSETSFPAIDVGLADDLQALDMLLQPGCAAAIWQRQIPVQVQNWLDRLKPEVLPHGRVILPADTVGDAVAHLFDMTSLPSGPERTWLHQDIVALAAVFADLMSADFLRLRLDVVTSNACRKFHIDSVTARLICTYRGTGTQYGVSTDGKEPERVYTAQTGAPMLLRGTLWPDQPPSGLLHRSPPIEGTGETRLVLVLDPIAEQEREPDRQMLH